MSAQGHTPEPGKSTPDKWTSRAIKEYQDAQDRRRRALACLAACAGLPDPERDVAEMRDALIRISNLDDHSAVRVLAVGIAQDVLARIKARAPEGTP